MLASLAITLTLLQIVRGVEVQLSNGVTIEGTWWQPSPNWQPVRAFFGVPYASSERFSVPTERSWSTTYFNATAYGPSCWQTPQAADPIKRVYSEDCLRVDIYAPPVSSKKRSVLVWIYGGSFDSGLSAFYDGSYLGQPTKAGSQMIVVSINYRVGSFGFLSTGLVDGNFGFLDQRLAMVWIKREISNFGGDPNAITVAGESAGAISILNHLVSDGSKGLFHKAIIQSGFPAAVSASDAVLNGQAFAKTVGCPASGNSKPALQKQLACLKSLTPSALNEEVLKFSWGMNIDGTIIPEDPRLAYKKGKAMDIPIVFGNCKNEQSAFFCPAFPKGIPKADYELNIAKFLSSFPWLGNSTKLATLIVQKFPSNAYPTTLQAFIDVITLLEWICPVTEAMQSVAEPNVIYQYVLELLPGWSNTCLGVGHSFDIPFLFPLLLPVFAGKDYKFSQKELELSIFLAESWKTFVISGHLPNVWKAFAPHTWDYTILDGPINTGKQYRLDECRWWWDILGNRE